LATLGSDRINGNATLKGLRHYRNQDNYRKLLQSCDESLAATLYPGLKQPWAEISQRFQR